MFTIEYSLVTRLDPDLQGHRPDEWPSMLREIGEYLKEHYEEAARAVELCLKHGFAKCNAEVSDDPDDWRVWFAVAGFDTEEEVDTWLTDNNVTSARVTVEEYWSEDDEKE